MRAQEPTQGRALNPEQIAAVRHGDGPQLVLAGAGSGKTRVITHRIAHLLGERGVPPYSLAAVTFTNKAATEMRERVERLAGPASGVFVGTFHRFAVRLLRRYGDRIALPREFTILDSADQKGLIKEALDAENLSDTAFQPARVLARISRAKNQLVSPDQFERAAQGFFDVRVALVYRRYQGLLRRAGGVDFDDLISGAVGLLEGDRDLGERMRRRLRYLMVDEFQDTNFAQLRLVLALTGPAGNLTAVGDEDQSIYRFRGAEIDNILRFEDTFPGATVRKLERNYRSTAIILEAASELVAHNEKRRGKRLFTDQPGGDPIELYRASDEGDEARYVVSALRQFREPPPFEETTAGQPRERWRFNDMAILVRTNSQTRSLEDELVRQRVPYHLIAGVRFYERAEVKDVVAYLRLLRNPRDNNSLRRIVNKPSRGIGKTTQDALFALAEEYGHSLWDVLRYDRLRGIGERAVRSLHGFRDLVVELRRAAAQRPLPELIELVLERTGYRGELERAAEPENDRIENLREVLSAARELVDDFGYADTPALATTTEDEPDPPVPGQPAPDQPVPADPVPDQPPPAQQQTLLLSGPAPKAPTDRRDWLTAGAAGDDPLTAFLDYVSLVSEADAVTTELGVSVMTLHAAKGLEFPVVVITGLEEGVLPHWNAQDSTDDVEEERRLLYVGITRARRRLLLSSCARRRSAGRYQDQAESSFLRELPARLIVVHESPTLNRSERTGAAASFSGYSPRTPVVADPLVGQLRKGCRVRHKTLGTGVVLELEGEGEDARLLVFFERAGKRKLVLRYAGLDVVS